MRALLLIVPVAFLLSGCALALEGAALEGAAVEGAAVEGAALGSSASIEAGAAEISVSDNLFGMAQERGVLSSALDDITAGGTRAGRMGLTQDGTLFADNKIIGRIDSRTGDIMGPRDVPAGYLDPEDARIYEFGKNGQTNAIAELHGFTVENGVELRPLDGSAVRVLQSRVYMDVLKIESGQYLIRLADGEVGLVSKSAVGLFLISLSQNQQNCPDQRGGAIILRSSITVPFTDCQEQNGTYILQTAYGTQMYASQHVASVLVGGTSEVRAEMGAYGGQPAKLGFESTVLRTESRSIWASYRPAYGPQAWSTFQRQFPGAEMNRSSGTAQSFERDRPSFSPNSSGNSSWNNSNGATRGYQNRNTFSNGYNGYTPQNGSSRVPQPYQYNQRFVPRGSWHPMPAPNFPVRTQNYPQYYSRPYYGPPRGWQPRVMPNSYPQRQQLPQQSRQTRTPYRWR